MFDLLIKNATNRRWLENKDPKHKKDASEGWHRYDTYFTIPVKGHDELEIRLNKLMLEKTADLKLMKNNSNK